MSECDLYINVILETISKIENSFNSTTKQEFMSNYELQDATLMRLQVIGETIKKIPFNLRNKNKDIKWKKFEKLRNIISHKYDSVDYNIIWSFIETNIEELKLGILNLREKLN